MPAAGETAHVRRLVVDRSRCGLGVSPASPGDTESPGTREGRQWPQRGRETLSMRMWGRRPGRPGECHPAHIRRAQSGWKGITMEIIVRGRHITVAPRFRQHATAKLARIEKLD